MFYEAIVGRFDSQGVSLEIGRSESDTAVGHMRSPGHPGDNWLWSNMKRNRPRMKLIDRCLKLLIRRTPRRMTELTTGCLLNLKDPSRST